LPPNARSWPFFGGERLGHGEVAIGAVRNHRLTRLKTEPGAIKLYQDQVRLERRQAGQEVAQIAEGRRDATRDWTLASGRKSPN